MTASELSRADRLRKFNDILAEYGLPAWEDRRLGDVAQGECEILDLVDLQELGPRRLGLTVKMIDPAGTERNVALRVGGTITFVVPLLTLLEGEFASKGPALCLAKRWRIEHGDWSMELPHALIPEGEGGDRQDPLASPAHRVLATVFGDVSVESLTAARIVPLGTFKVKGEANLAEAYLFASTVLRNFPRRFGDGAIVKVGWDAIEALLDGGKAIAEPSTAATLYRALRKYPPQKKS